MSPLSRILLAAAPVLLLPGCCPVPLGKTSRTAKPAAVAAQPVPTEAVAVGAPVAREIADALAASPKTKPLAGMIRISATETEVTLDGKVPLRDDITEVVRVATEKAGDRTVLSHLKLGGQPLTKEAAEKRKWSG